MLLQRIPRLSFDNIESIISIFGIEVSLDQKIVAATRHALMQSEAERGDTCGPLERVLLRTQEITKNDIETIQTAINCLLYTSPSPRDRTRSRMPSSA